MLFSQVVRLWPSQAMLGVQFWDHFMLVGKWGVRSGLIYVRNRFNSWVEVKGWLFTVLEQVDSSQSWNSSMGWVVARWTGWLIGKSGRTHRSWEARILLTRAGLRAEMTENRDVWQRKLTQAGLGKLPDQGSDQSWDRVQRDVWEREFTLQSWDGWLWDLGKKTHHGRLGKVWERSGGPQGS